MDITSKAFGKTKDGRTVTEYSMTNDKGMSVKILSLGCIIRCICVPDKNGEIRDVVLGYDTAEDYENGSVFYGAFVGRYANRIKGARFTLNGKVYELEKNSGENHIHGIYPDTVFDGHINGNTLVLSHLSPAFDEGYPGNLSIEVRYTLTNDNALEIEYKAQTDDDTVINLTNHSYFNLNGQDGSDILEHRLMMNSDSFTEVNSDTIPTGRILSVEGTPLDFRETKTIGRDITADCEQLRLCGGYDHNMIIGGSGLRLFACAASDISGIKMECLSTQPAVQLYSGNYIATDTVKRGKCGIRYPKRGGFCLEAQHYPCSPNFDEFPNTVLKPDEEYYQKTVYRFYT